MSALGVRFSRWGAIQIFVPLPFNGPHSDITITDIIVVVHIKYVVILKVLKSGAVFRLFG